MQFPQVNLNGTSRTDLQEQAFNCLKAIENAIEILQRNAPHGRDYQTLDSNAYATARKEHYLRLYELETIKKEYENLIKHLTKEGN